jgi:hypothetical protein
MNFFGQEEAAVNSQKLYTIETALVPIDDNGSLPPLTFENNDCFANIIFHGLPGLSMWVMSNQFREENSATALSHSLILGFSLRCADDKRAQVSAPDALARINFISRIASASATGFRPGRCNLLSFLHPARTIAIRSDP